ncbi:Ros/MucR family transcriptional regulator [Xanthobacter versatilis]|uniref:MucR family transcriptional regulator n=1 Tax=Xanthobacter autotrophicus (strain ATCC BAA-1158 / Py2) TaxID=78245 RepID=UPI0037288444
MSLEDNETRTSVHLDLVVDIVAAFVGNNTVPLGELPALIASVYATLGKLDAPAAAPIEAHKPAVPVKKSVTADFIVCLEDGKKFKSLKRHLRTHYDLSPEAYREKWGLPHDYPMVAPSYAAARSELAKTMGLGQVRKQAAPEKKASGRRKAATA